MYASIAATAVLFASAHLANAESTCGTRPGWGQARILNKCNEDAIVVAAPAGGNPGVQQYTSTISQGQTFTQPWTGLETGGWSLKVYPKNPPAGPQQVLQYEYNTESTFNEGIMWWDISAVNGNPYNANWALQADKDSCKPDVYAYACSEDDFKAMQQPCSLDTNIQLNLCEASPSQCSLGKTAAGSNMNAQACPAGRNGIMPTAAGVQSGQSAASPSDASSPSAYEAPSSPQASATSAVSYPQGASQEASVVSTTLLTTHTQAATYGSDAAHAPTVVMHTEVETAVTWVVETVTVDAKRRRDSHLNGHRHHQRAI